MAKAEKLIPDHEKEQTLAEIDVWATEYTALKEAEKENAKVVASLKGKITPLVKKMGTVDEKESISLKTENHVVELKARRSVSVNAEKAKKILQKKGLWQRVTVRVIDNAKLEEAHLDDEISDAEMNDILNIGVTHALYVNRRTT